MPLHLRAKTEIPEGFPGQRGMVLKVVWSAVFFRILLLRVQGQSL